MPPTGDTTQWDAEALRQGRLAAGWSYADAARHLGHLIRQRHDTPPPSHDSLVRSLKRWENGVRPRGVYPTALAELIRSSDPRYAPGVTGLYERRALIPRQRWDELLHRARHRVDIWVYAGLFLPEEHPDVIEVLATIAHGGGQVRLLAGDPDCDAVRRRSVEEGIGEQAIGAKIRNVLALYKQLRTVEGVEVRLHNTTLYTSLYRFDDTMVVNHHIYGLPAAHSPALVVDQGPLFAAYLQTFDTVWATSARAWKGP